MIDPERAEAALVGVRELVAADGGDILVASTTDDTVRLMLVLESAACAECVMPRPFLETVALDMMRPELPGLAVVVIDDPRE
jgi:Fe-S cluster biogenesis protein NfuA